ncbi:MAG: hypothetical protein K2N67_05780, partial [Mucispirillum sp.]|nr:hypothetical protein [Mucispirillum sp.]
GDIEGDEAGALPSDDIAGDVSEVAPDELPEAEDTQEEEPQEELAAAIPEDEPLAPEEPVLSEEIAGEVADIAGTPADSAEPDISDETAAEPEPKNAPLFDDDDWLNDAPDTDTAAKPIQEEPAVSETAEEAVEPLADETLPAEDEIAADIPEQDDEAAVPADDEPAAEELLPEEPADIDDNIEVAEETDTAADESIPEEPAETVDESEESEAAPIEDEALETPDTDGDIEGDEAGALPSDDIAGDVSEVAPEELSEAEDTLEEEPQEESAPAAPVSPQGLPDVKEADIMPDEPAPARFGGITVTISRDEIMSMLGNAIDKHFLEEAVKEVLARNMQDIVRNIVPAIAEKYIKEEIERLKNDE